MDIQISKNNENNGNGKRKDKADRVVWYICGIKYRREWKNASVGNIRNYMKYNEKWWSMLCKRNV